MASARGVGAVRALLVLALACAAALGSGVEARRDGSRLFQVGVRGRTLAELEDLGGVELKQEQMRIELQDGLKTMRKERKAIAGSGKKIEKVADEAEEISDKWRDIQVALLELYNVEPQTTPDDDDFYKTKVEEIRTHLASIYETAIEAASKAGESVSLANDAADAFVDSEIKTEEGDLGAVAEMEDVEQDVAEVAQKAAEEGEEVAGEANDIAESAETAGEQLDDFIAEVEGGDEDKIKESLETLQQTVEDETEMAEQLEDDASLIASEAEQAALRAETEKQNIIQEADNLGLDLETN
ncbi:hypothetical protein HKI87_07g47420 [Chloropicon roscoffensis]|uniref:Uncharacterized protein n=1 Tax=Chloropicon roscoffensis TaxID=1461544 RepID=A0AAX4PB14_9CHLO